MLLLTHDPVQLAQLSFRGYFVMSKSYLLLLLILRQ